MKILKYAVIAILFAAEPVLAQSLTGSQNNAVRSVKQYLDIAGFSRSGLIRQLSSNAGDGYDVADATIAVDSLNVDWNKEAVKSAKQYLSVSGFRAKALSGNFHRVPEMGTPKAKQNMGRNKPALVNEQRA